MPHLRKRHAEALLKKKLKFAPVVAIQGARQIGKSVLAREIIAEQLKDSVFVTFDDEDQQSVAEQRPGTFLLNHAQAHPLIIDEAQKVPKLFDAVKAQVDQNRKPGRYLLLGSTEFSKAHKIRESLTGRMTRIRLYPFNIAEAHSLPVVEKRSEHLLLSKPRFTRKAVLDHIARGGLPGVFSIRNELERHSAIQDILDLICHRDILQYRCNPKAALNVIKSVCKAPLATAGYIAKDVNIAYREVNKILAALCELFVLIPVPPNRLGKGKTIYYPYDSSLIEFYSGPFERKLCTWFLMEQLSQRSYGGEIRWEVTHYQTARGSPIHFIIEKDDQVFAYKIITTEGFDLRDLNVLNAYSDKAKLRFKKISLFALAPISAAQKIDGVQLYPWESIG